MAPVRITYFSDVLCVWAYAAQIKLARLDEAYAERVTVEARFCAVFTDAWSKVSEAWKGRGGFEGFNAHLREVARQLPHVEIHDRLWLDVKPRSSTGAHLFLKSVELVQEEDAGPAGPPARFVGSLVDRAGWALRRAFFAEARDISDWGIHREIAEALGIDYGRIERHIRSSAAVARLDADLKLAAAQDVRGSPTFVMNDGRQKLYGNVGYRLLEANVDELLRHRPADEASWC